MKKLILLSTLFLHCAATSFAQSFFQFYFNFEGARHDVLMSIESDSDIDVWVKYYDADSYQYVVVHQDASAVTGARGVAILCENPTYDGTRKRANYNADNFFLVSDAYGNYTMYNTDDSGAYSQAYGLKELRTKSDLVRAYQTFVKN